MVDYNADVEIKDLNVRVGNTINLAFNYYEWNETTQLWVLTDLTGQQIDCHVKDSSGTVIKAWSSAGVSPAITISTSSFSIDDLIPFASVNEYDFDFRKTNGTDVKTIRAGKLKVEKSITGEAVVVPIDSIATHYRITEVGSSAVLQYTSDGVNWSTVITLYSPV